MSLPISHHLKYRAYVDGLRAVAVLPVLFFHANLGFTGGYVGVDIFFVISGYLITGLILKDLNAGQFYIVKFWERRVRRILPALVVVVFSTLVAGWFLLLPQAFKELGESASAQALLFSNIYFWIKSWIGAGYFAPVASVKPLLHTWSLAVEEQFYLFFPFLLLAIKRFSHKSIVPAILLLGGVSFGSSVFCSYFYSSFNFYFLPTRAWELLIGAFLAATPVPERAPIRWMTESLSWGGLLAIVCAVFCYDHNTRFPGVSALLPCIGAGALIWANSHTLTSAGKLLALRPVVFTGLISYSLYLWHWPVLVFFKYWAIDPVPPGQRMLLLLTSLVLAVLSWKYVETPFRQRSIFKTRPQIFAFGFSATTVLLISGLVIFKLHGLPSRLLTSKLPTTALQYVNGDSRVIWDHEVTLNEALAGNFVVLGTGNKQQPIGLLVWGDSHAMAVMPVLDLLCKEHRIRGVAATHSATTPLLGYRSTKSNFNKDDNLAYNNAVREFILKNHIPNVVIVARWDNDEIPPLRSGIIATINALNGSGTRIWIMREVPIQHWDVPNALATTVWHGGDPEKIGLPLAEYQKEFKRQNPIFEGLAAKYAGITVLDPTYFLVSSNNLCRVVEGGKPLYCDNSHLTATGAMLLRPLFEPIFVGVK